MYKDPPPRDRINSFAFVTYIPEPLAGFLDRLRQELVPNCFLRAHVTILPPRPLSSPPEAAWSLISALAPRFAPFDVALSNIEIFPVSDVIYVNVQAGSDELKRMHDAFSIDGLRFQEPFSYQPHVTLAQELQTDELDELIGVARARWAEFSGAKSFRVEKAVFVQNTRRNEWVDLGECSLGQTDSRLVGELTDLLAG
jgi:2'-5' RNA ligase